MSLDSQGLVAVMVAITGLIGAVATLVATVRNYHQLVNSRMDQLLDLTRSAAHAQGVAEGATPEIAR